MKMQCIKQMKTNNIRISKMQNICKKIVKITQKTQCFNISFIFKSDDFLFDKI